MNKILTTALLAVTTIAGAGGYLYANPDKNFAEYIPESVSSLVGDYLPSQLKETIVGAGSEGVQPVTQPAAQAQVQQVQEKEVVLIEAHEDIAPQTEGLANEVGSNTNNNSEDDAVKNVMTEIQSRLNEVSEPKPNLVTTTSNDPKAKLLVKKINDTSSKILKLDIENKALEEKFQQIIKKNRELAKKLQAIDKELSNVK